MTIKIEKIEYDDKKLWFTYELSTGKVLHLSYETYISLGLHQGQTIPSGTYEYMLEEDERNLARSRAESYALFQPRTAFELDRKLQREGIRSEIRQDILAWLERRGLIDDARYAVRYAREKSRLKSWSIMKIRAMLRQKGIDHDLILQALDAIDQGREEANVVALLEKKYGRRNLTDQKSFDSTYRAMARRGFPPPLVLKVMKDMREKRVQDED